MRNVGSWMLGTALALAGTTARAGEVAPPAALAGRCQAEVAAHCTGDAAAAPGGVAACLAGHRSELGKTCRTALRRAVRVGAFRAACGEDVASACAGVTPGQGRVRACLKAHQATLSAACQARLARKPASRAAAAEDDGLADEAASEERAGVEAVPADLPVDEGAETAAPPPAPAGSGSGG